MVTSVVALGYAAVDHVGSDIGVERIAA
jgi:hypothetical protein